jgi:hypothetical protein
MKKFLAIAGIVSVLSTPQVSQACIEDSVMYLGLAMIGSITLAPTGSTFTSAMLADCREEVLAIKEDAQQFTITGEASPLLQTAFAGAKSVQPEMSNEQMAARFIGLNLDEK